MSWTVTDDEEAQEAFLLEERIRLGQEPDYLSATDAWMAAFAQKTGLSGRELLIEGFEKVAEDAGISPDCIGEPMRATFSAFFYARIHRMNGKGSRYRDVDARVYQSNFEDVFGKELKHVCKRWVKDSKTGHSVCYFCNEPMREEVPF